MKKIGILGCGAIGSVISSQLFDNQKAQLFHYNRSEIKKINLETNSKLFSYSIDCQTVINENQKLDWLIICLKEHHFEQASNWFKNLISAQTKVAVIRNGINLKEPLLPFCESENILECMIDCPVQKDKNGVYQQFRNPKITAHICELADEFSKLFIEREIAIEQVEDFKTASWIKLCESTAIGALTCLTGKPCLIFQDEKMIELYLRILKECVAVGIADGANFPDNYISEMLSKLKSYPPEKGSSMLSDRLAGKEIELGAKNGAIMKIGKKVGMKTPLNELVCVSILNEFTFNVDTFLKK